MSCRPYVTIVSLSVAIRVANFLAVAKNSALTCLCHHLTAAVAIEVGHSEVDRVSCNDVWTRHDAPHKGAVELIGVENGNVLSTLVAIACTLTGSCDIAIGIVVSEQSLDDNLHLTITIEVAY